MQTLAEHLRQHVYKSYKPYVPLDEMLEVGRAFRNNRIKAQSKDSTIERALRLSCDANKRKPDATKWIRAVRKSSAKNAPIIGYEEQNLYKF